MVIIRSMEERDLSSVTALTAQLGYPSTLDAIARRYRAIIGSDDCALYVAEVSGTAAGWAYVRGVLLLEDDRRAEV